MQVFGTPIWGKSVVIGVGDGAVGWALSLQRQTDDISVTVSMVG